MARRSVAWWAASMVLWITAVGCANGTARTTTGRATARSSLPISDDSLARAVAEYTDRLSRVGFSGVVVVERAGRLLHARGRGLADREAGKPYTTGTVWSMGSITKPFTATAILNLVRRGDLSLADSLGRFIEGLPPDRSGITIEHLLTHRGGLAAPDEGDFVAVDRDRIEEIARRTRLLFEPGSEYAYSNLGYSLLGVVLEEAMEEPYETHLRRELLTPAGLYETGYVQPGWDPARLAVGYENGDRFGTLIERMPPDGPHWILKANGGLHTTAFDMLRWVRASLRGEVFGEEIASQLTRSRVERFPGAAVSLGWALDTSRDGAPSVHHDGSNGIFWADVRFFPVQDLVIVVATNVAELPAGSVASSLERLAFGEPASVPPRIEPVSLTTEAREALTGEWRVGEEGRVGVSWTGESLELAVEGQDLIDRFLTLEDGEPALLREMNRRSRMAIEAAVRGDRTGIAAALGRETAPEFLATLIPSLEEDLEAYRSFEVLGTAPVWYASPYATWIRFRFEGGDHVRRIHWSESGAYYGFGGQAYRAPLILPCAGSGPRECTGFHLVLPVRAPVVAVRSDGLELRMGEASVRAVPATDRSPEP